MRDFSKIPLFKDFGQEGIIKIRKYFIERVYPKGTTMFVEGQKSDGIYIIVSGLVKIFKLHNDGREKTLAIMGEGEIIGEMSLLDNELRSATVETLERTTVLVISKDDFVSLLQNLPVLPLKIIEVLSNRLRQANQQIEELTFMNVRCRVICNLIQLAKEYGKSEKNEIKISIQLTHAELANFIGVSRETVTKVLGELQDSKLIKLARKQLWISDLDGLYKAIV